MLLNIENNLYTVNILLNNLYFLNVKKKINSTLPHVIFNEIRHFFIFISLSFSIFQFFFSNFNEIIILESFP